MEQIIQFDQFYYTNYGQGMRFEGSSIQDHRNQDELKLLAANWMKLDTVVPVESVSYNSRLGRYVAAMIVPCTKAGDARTSYWIHGVLPTEGSGSSFLECLSWPLAAYETNVRQNQNLSCVKQPEKLRLVSEICQHYGLQGEKLEELIYKVWQTVCGQDKPSTLYFILNTSQAENYNETARDIMTVVYHILPKLQRHQADYQAWAENDIRHVRFVFRNTSDSDWQFNLNPGSAGDLGEIAEEEQILVSVLRRNFEQNTDQYSMIVNQLYGNEAESFRDFVWNYQFDRVKKGHSLGLSQEVLKQSQPYLKHRAAEDERFRRLYCRCLSEIDIEDEKAKFIQIVIEEYILAAAQLTDRSVPEYANSLTDNWRLLEKLRAGSLETAASYLEWIRKASVVYYQDFVERGLLDGKTWLFKVLGGKKVNSPKELFQWMQEAAFLGNVKAYQTFVAEKAEELYMSEMTTDEERRKLQPYCRNAKEMDADLLKAMSYPELMQIDLESMDETFQQLWMAVMADRIRENETLVTPAAEAYRLLEMIATMKIVLKAWKAGETQQDFNCLDKENMTVILQAVSQYDFQMDIQKRLILFALLRYTSNLEFGEVCSGFWKKIRPEDYGRIYEQPLQLKKVLKRNQHLNYYCYRLYDIYRRKGEEPYGGTWENKEREVIGRCLGRLRGAYQPVLKAVSDYWKQHEDADNHLFYDFICMMADEDALALLLEDYAGEGRKQAKRVEDLLNFDREKAQEPEEKMTGRRRSDAWMCRKLPWILSACVGLYMGLMVNGWYMAVHLSKLLMQPMLVWAGAAGIAILTAVLMALADRLVRDDAAVRLTYIPWTGLWLLINLVFSWFAGNKITAAVTFVVLIAVYIWMRKKKCL